MNDEPGAGNKSSQTSESAQPDEPTEEGMTSFIQSYLATVTTDPAAGWKRLTPAFQAASGGFASYQRYWGTIRSATPSGIVANPDEKTVTYSVDYVLKNGKTSSDQVTLVLAQKDGDYLIAGES